MRPPPIVTEIVTSTVTRDVTDRLTADLVVDGESAYWLTNDARLFVLHPDPVAPRLLRVHCVWVNVSDCAENADDCAANNDDRASHPKEGQSSG
jgi:hypothetical protein